jgi:hypothetical protein
MVEVLWTKAFVLAALEAAVVTGLSTFGSSLIFTDGQPTVKGVIAAATASGIAALIQFTKSLGATQTVSALKEIQSIEDRARHAA